MRKRVIKLTLEYDGTGYAGWQIQPGVATVQGALEEALEKILKEPTRVHGAGRTDAGVHAAGQVAHFETAGTVTAEEFERALNALLPADVRVVAAEEAPPGFHARYAARSRTYRYAVTFADSVFTRRHAHYVAGPLDVEPMRETAAALVGKHDFAAFGNLSEDYDTTARDVTELRLEETLGGLEFYVTANAFLYKMVRNVVAALLAVGRGELTSADVKRVLEDKDRAALGPPAPPRGLTLMRVTYSRI
ncbi:MAG: tRNA pseudouridine(38-40) synthase TruA [candidate division Zixibacteria bacterium]|nr:tRNA pseudouridine(38-40) synthase TruA [candidate division Zixibacteria bacterium]